MTTDQPMHCDRCSRPHATAKGGPSCRGHKRDGSPCTNPPMIDQLVCRMHGGAAPQARAKAAERQAEEQAARVLTKVWDRDAAPVTDAVAAMQRLAGRLENAVDVLGDRLVDDAVSLDAPEALAWQRVVRELRQLLEAMERLGIAQRYVQVEAARVGLIAGALERALEVAGVDVETRALVGRVLLEELRAGEQPKGVAAS